MTGGRHGPGAALDDGLAGLRRAYGLGLTPAAVVDEVLARIAAANDPAIWIEVEPAAALHRAAGALRSARRGGLPLWGVPFGVKDNIDVAGRTTTGALPGIARRADRSAAVVERLLAAGAIYIGKTNLDQLATGLVGTRSPYGTPRNPLDPTLVPGGSSSGSAVAVARGQVTFALGTDTAGSGRVPAAMCGIVGLKGAPGTRPMDGVLPASPSIDCVSTFTRSLTDGLEVEGVIAGTPWPHEEGPHVVAMGGVGDELRARLADSGHQMASADLTLFHEAGDLLYGGPWLAERTAALSHLLDGDPAGVNATVSKVIAGGHAYSGVDVFAAQRRLRHIATELWSWWDEVDVLVIPTIEWAPTLAEVATDPVGVNLRLGRNTTFANLLDLAAITLPTASGPGGVTLYGPASHAGRVAAVAATLAGEPLRGGIAV